VADRDLIRIKLMLRLAALRRYAALPIPAEEDVLVEQFIREWRSGSGTSPQAAEALDGVKGSLGVFAVRAASRAVRNRDIEAVRLGFRALCMAGREEEDYRELDGITAVLCDSCKRLGFDPALEVQTVLPNARGDAGRILNAFAGSLPAVSLEKHRMREGSDEDGFRYRWGWEDPA